MKLLLLYVYIPQTVGYYYDDSDEDDESDEENEPTATRDDNNTDGTGQYRLMRMLLTTFHS
jgi:hypothetical protein